MSSNRKDFLNAGILGGGAGVPQRRGFRAVSVEYIGGPDYDAKFFETFPTVWASAYAFRKSLEAEARADENGRRGEHAVAGATEEWATLFLLHYFGIVHLAQFPQHVLEAEYDKDLWVALRGTFPSAKDSGVSEVLLLMTDDGAVVGAYYPEIVFFPARGRESWGASEILAPYLRGPRLSWAAAARILLDEETSRADFHTHLRLAADRALQGSTLKTHLNKFCREVFGHAPPAAGRLDPHPLRWEVPGSLRPDPEEFLGKYPLVVSPNDKGGKTYYLVSGMPHPSPWMTTAIASGWPSPAQYRRAGAREILVKFAGSDIRCPLGDQDEIVLLRDLFLADSPFWCKLPRSSETHASHFRTLHEVELRDSILTARDTAVCLAPVRREFLQHFPETFQNLKSIYVVPGQGGAVEWLFPVRGREVRWVTKPVGSTDMPNTSLMMWPPKVSRRWKLYAAYGTGSKETAGRWHLVDENGWQGKTVELEEDEYVSFLQRPGNTPNRPRAVLFTDTNDRERGVLFLADFEEQAIDAEGRASLAVDFGTSNTCLAYNAGQSEILRFRLSPLTLWGKRQPEGFDRLGFVPTSWGGAKGFFPTVLLSRRFDERLPDLSPDELQLEHLFKVDMPGLHRQFESRLYEKGIYTTWRLHSNLKWDPDPRTPWRALFLELTLLYAHAEMFFNRASVADSYIFTFPLAFGDTFRKRYHEQAQGVIRKIRQCCYGTDPQADSFRYVPTVDESTAIAESIREHSSATAMEVFVDVGGGTADIAVRHDGHFLVLDSLEVAGKTFFRFAERNFKPGERLAGAAQFKRHLGRLLQGKEQELTIPSFDRQLDLSTFYSVAINDLSDETFRGREENIIKKGMGSPSYQRYRSRLFFRHVLAYALLQACAAAVDGRLRLANGIKLILGGNAWGLMLFAELPRSTERLEEEARQILMLLKRQLAGSVRGEEREYLEGLEIFGIELLNEEDLSRAKTSVAVGALKADPEAAGRRRNTMPFSGVTIRELKINDFNPSTVRWCDRWGFDQFKSRFGFMDEVHRTEFEGPEDSRKPLDPVLSAFACLGNTVRNDQDNMPEATWTNINAEIARRISLIRGDRLGPPPANHFLSEVLYPENAQRDFLDVLAERNGNYKPDSKEE